MSFKLLKQVISHIRKQLRCPKCKSGFDEDSIFVIASSPPSDNGVSSGILLAVCPECTTESFVLMEVSSLTTQFQKQKLQIQTHMAGMTGKGKVSMNEVLDMHNFLKNWRGDIKELLKETSQ